MKIKNKNSLISTIMGGIVAVSTALVTIDFANFDVKKEWPKIVLSALIALGGYMTKLNVNENVNPNNGTDPK